MKEIYLLEVTQHSVKRYIGVASARDLVRLATTAELGEVQDAQRPINLRRLSEIAQFVAADGTLSTSIVIGTKDDRLSVSPAGVAGIPNLYKMSFPVTDAEFDSFKDAFDIMDGQHRLFSFLSEYCKLPDGIDFDITFEMYIKPTMRDRRLVFKNTNEKQEKVASNLLMWFREKLNMLNAKEQAYHPLVTLLNSESCSPLKGRIIMGAEKKTGGIKAEQLINILDKADIKHIRGKQLSDEKMLTLVSDYLCGWEEAVGSKFVDRDSSFGPFSKVAGLRFMILILPEFVNHACAVQSYVTKDYTKDTINTLFAEQGLEPADLFIADSDYLKNLGFNPFASETNTTTFAKDWSNKLSSLSSGEFDPLA